jgi:hypothetical protein
MRVAHWCSLVWIPSTRACASSNKGKGGVGCGSSVFTGDLLACQSHGSELAVPLPHVAGSPGRRALRRLRHAQMPSVGGRPACRRAGRTAGRAASGRFPRSLGAGQQGWCPAFPRQPRHEYAAGLPLGLLGRKGRDVRSRHPPGSSPWVACAADRPTSARFEPALPLAGAGDHYLAVPPGWPRGGRERRELHDVQANPRHPPVGNGVVLVQGKDEDHDPGGQHDGGDTGKERGEFPAAVKAQPTTETTARRVRSSTSVLGYHHDRTTGARGRPGAPPRENPGRR